MDADTPYQYSIFTYVHTDGGSTIVDRTNITDAPHKIRAVWQASSGVGADDGFCHLYIDDVLEKSLTGVDNDTLSVDEVRFGACSALDAGTYGIFYMDDCKITFPVEQTLLINDADGTWIDTIYSGGAMMFYSDGEEWREYKIGNSSRRHAFGGFQDVDEVRRLSRQYNIKTSYDE